MNLVFLDLECKILALNVAMASFPKTFWATFQNFPFWHASYIIVKAITYYNIISMSNVFHPGLHKKLGGGVIHAKDANQAS